MCIWVHSSVVHINALQKKANNKLIVWIDLKHNSPKPILRKHRSTTGIWKRNKGKVLTTKTITNPNLDCLQAKSFYEVLGFKGVFLIIVIQYRRAGSAFQIDKIKSEKRLGFQIILSSLITMPNSIRQLQLSVKKFDGKILTHFLMFVAWLLNV